MEPDRHPEQIKQLVDNDFATYYSENPAQSFAFQVWTNNALVAARSRWSLGITLVGRLSCCCRTPRTSALTGGADDRQRPRGRVLRADHAARAARADRGLRRRRGRAADSAGPGSIPARCPAAEALAAAGREAITVALGLVGVLLVSGVIEAFVTPSPLPTWARIGIGALAEAAFLAYVFLFGRRARRQRDRPRRGDLVAELGLREAGGSPLPA